MMMMMMMMLMLRPLVYLQFPVRTIYVKPVQDNLLATLGVMTRAAKNVAMESGDLSSKDNKKFGHLHIVFRDWQAENCDRQSTHQALFQEEAVLEAATR